MKVKRAAAVNNNNSSSNNNSSNNSNIPYKIKIRLTINMFQNLKQFINNRNYIIKMFISYNKTRLITKKIIKITFVLLIKNKIQYF